jgi:predicted ATP-grasp superfamily ATP-dependent carboligase
MCTYGDRRGTYKVLEVNLRQRDYSEELSVDGTIVLEEIFEKWDERVWVLLMWLRIGTRCGLL